MRTTQKQQKSSRSCQEPTKYYRILKSVKYTINMAKKGSNKEVAAVEWPQKTFLPNSLAEVVVRSAVCSEVG